MKKISKLDAPALAGVIKEKNTKAAIAAITNCLYGGANLIDLHLSCLENTDEASLSRIITASKLPILALNYNVRADGTEAGYTEDERAELFLRAVKAGASGIDMQGYTFSEKARDAFVGENKYSFTKNMPKEVVTDKETIEKQCAFIERIHSMGSEVLLSCHPGIYMSAEEVTELALFLETRGADIIKIVTTAADEDQLIESFRAMLMLKKELKTPISYHASGAAGTLSRIVNPMLGGHLIFCNDGYKEGSILEQPNLSSVRKIIEEMSKII